MTRTENNVPESVLTETEETTTWKLDASHSHAQFKVRHMMITNVNGEFTDLDGELRLNAEDPELSYVETNIRVSSVNTKDEGRDAHLRSGDFFDAEHHPVMTFRSKKWEKRSDDEYLVTGDLTIRGVTHEVKLTVEGPSEELVDPWGGVRIGFSAHAKINRRDFGLTWNAALEAGGVLVGDEVKLSIDAQFVKQS